MGIITSPLAPVKTSAPESQSDSPDAPTLDGVLGRYDACLRAATAARHDLVVGLAAVVRTAHRARDPLIGALLFRLAPDSLRLLG